MKKNNHPYTRRPSILLAVAAVALAITANPAHAETRYQWNGSPTVSSVWTTAANWSASGGGLTAGPGASNTSGNYRLNVYNGANAKLVYSATQGTTVYANTEVGGRGLVVSSATSAIAGNLEITGGSFSTLGSSSGDVIGNAAAGTLTVSGGSFIGAGSAAGGTILGLNSGALWTSTLNVSGTGSATFTKLQMSAGTTIVNLDGGTLTANEIVDVDNSGVTGNSNTTFHFNGGTLTAGAGAVTAFMSGLTNAYVKSGGALIDTAGANITIGQALLAGTPSGGLTKSGSGTLTLTGANTYTGDTNILDGTLALSATSELKFVVTDTPNANMISGSGSATINGIFNIDTSGVSGATGHIWLLVDRAALSGESFGETFSISGFTQQVDGVTWKMSDAKGAWSFSETTGELTLDIGSDYDTWKSANGVTGGMNDDDDNDGLSNHDEYAFGLAPKDGSSCDPIKNQLNKTNGVFSYTRRDTSKTDLSYSVWFSTNLVDWTEDTLASEGSPVLTGEVETVDVTLSALPGAPLPDTLFIQVRAN